MTRILTIVFCVIFIAMMFLGVLFIKDSYKLLPIHAEGLSTPGTFADWKDYNGGSEAFHVMLPAPPQHATQVVKDKKTGEDRFYDMTVAQKSNGTVFMVSIIHFKGSEGAPAKVQKTVVNDLVAANPENQLKTMKVGEFQQFKTLDFSIQNSQMILEGMTFVDGERLYLLSALFPITLYSPEEFQFFIQSFELARKSDKT